MSISDRFSLIISGGGDFCSGKGNKFAAFLRCFLFAPVVFSVVSVCAGGPQPVCPRYEVVDLGTLGGKYSSAFGINESGQVVGESETADHKLHAFVWDKNAGMIDLGTLGGGASHAYAINNRGQVVGSARTSNNELHAFLWEGGKMIDLGLLPVGSCTEAMSINDAGQVVGNARTSASIYSSQRAFLWENGKMIDLGAFYTGANGSAAEINIRGQVVGTSGDRAFLWESGMGMELLTNLPTSQGNAINDSGLAVLASNGHYYVCHKPDVLVDMNLVRYSRTNAINSSGTVVGDFDYLSDDHYHAFLWDESCGMIDLNDVVAAGSVWKELNSAGDISDDGCIAGYGETIADPGISRAFVMNPIPPVDYLVAHWELDESSGDIASDSAGGNDGVLKGNRHWQPYGGRMNGALMFDGSGDYVDCGNGSALNISEEVTVAAWVTIDQVHVDWQTIVAKGDSAYRLSTAEDEMKFHFAVTGEPWNYLNGETIVGQGEWHHVCGTYDGEYMRLYVDGVEEPSSPLAESNGVGLNDYNLYIGENDEKPDRYWDGMIDDVRLYSCPLTSKEVHDLFLEAPIYVDVEVSQIGSNNGLSWEKAYDSPQKAFPRVPDGGRIHVARGVYTPDRGSYTNWGDPCETFQLVDGVSIKGGYAGYGEASPGARDYQLYESVLSGDLEGNDEAGFVNMDDNSYHVVSGSGVGRGTLLEGFTIRGGNDVITGRGGGMVNVSGSPTVRDCIFTGNMAARGGGIYNESADPTLIGVRFVDNKAFLSNAADDVGGGGIYNYQSNPRLEDCLFAGNSAGALTGNGGDGGAIFCSQSHLSLINCVVRGNRARCFGGGMASRFGGGAWMANCVFNANSAESNGGGLYLGEADALRMTNCTLSQNFADSGGGIYSSSSNPTLVNCILQGNDDDSGGIIENAQIRKVGGTLTIDYSCVEGWSGALGGQGNIGADAHFVDADGPDNTVGTEDDNLRLDFGSPCIDAGNNVAVVFIATDLDGNPRIISYISETVDMGAYEFAGELRWYVDGVNGNDNNNGLSPETAFATIQKGIDTAVEGYTVVVFPGVYVGTILFRGKAVTVTGEGSGATILEAQDYAVRFHSTEDANSVLKNVVIRNCGSAGIFISGCSPKITNVTVVGNNVGIAKYEWGMPVISNSILWGNAEADVFGCQGNCEITYSCIERGVEGDGNISMNPRFADLAGGDYHLLSQRGRHRPSTNEWILDDLTSPCVDAGEPWVNPSGEQMPNGGRLNMGAFGGTNYASMSEWPLKGDVNRDGVINMSDFALLAESWLLKLEWAE